MATPTTGLRRPSSALNPDAGVDLLLQQTNPDNIRIERERQLSDIGQGDKSLILGNLQNEAANINADAAAAAALGDEDKATQLAQRGLRLNQEAQRFRPEVFETKDINGFGDALTFARNQAVSQVGNAGQVAGTALTAAALVSNPVAGGLRAAVPFAGKAIAKGLGKVSGGAAGTAGAAFESARLNTGEIAGNVLLDPDSPNTIQERGAAAIGGGTLAGALDVIPAAAVFKRFGLGKTLDGFIKRSLKATLGQGVTEAGTEAVQTVIGRATHKLLNENIEVLGDEGIHEIVEAMAAGFAGGAALGGVTSGVASTVQLGADFAANKGPVSERFDQFDLDDEQAASPVAFSKDDSGTQPLEVVIPKLISAMSPEGSLLRTDPGIQEQVLRLVVQEATKPGTLGDIGLQTLTNVFGSEQIRDAVINATSGQIEIANEQAGVGIDQQDQLGENLDTGFDEAENLNTGGFSEIEQAELGPIEEQTIVQRVGLSQQLAELKGKDSSKITNQDKALENRLERLQAQDPSRELSIVNGVIAVQAQTGERGMGPVIEFGRSKINTLLSRHKDLPAAEITRLSNLTDDEVIEFVRDNFQSIVAAPIAKEFQSGDVEVLTPKDLRSGAIDLGEGGAVNAQRIKVGLPRADGKKGFVEKQISLTSLITRLKGNLQLDERDATSSNEAALTSIIGELIRLNDEGVIQFDPKTISPDTRIFGRKISNLITLKPLKDTITSKEDAVTAGGTKLGKKISGIDAAIAAVDDEIKGISAAKGNSTLVGEGPDAKQVTKANSIKALEAKKAGLVEARDKLKNPKDAELGDKAFDESGNPTPVPIKPIREKPTIDSVKEERFEERESPNDGPTSNVPSKKSQKVEVEKERARILLAKDKLTNKEKGELNKLKGDRKPVKTVLRDKKEEGPPSLTESLVLLGNRLKTKASTRVLSPEKAAEVREGLNNTAKNWAKAIGLKKPVRIVSAEEFAKLSKQPLADIQKAAGATQDMSKEVIITVNVGMDKTSQFSTLAHEFAHAVLRNVEIPTQLADDLLTDYRKFLEASGDTNLSQELARLSPAEIRNRLNSLLGGVSSIDKDYSLSFDEWFAERASAWFQSNAKPQTLVDKYFKGIADALKAVIAAFRGDVLLNKNVNVSYAVSDFFDMLFTKAPELSQQTVAMDEHIVDTALKGGLKGISKEIKRLGMSETQAMSIGGIGFSNNGQLGTTHAYNRLNANEKRLLANLFSQPRILKQLLAELQHPLGMRSVLDNDPQQAIALGYRMWKAGRLNIGPQSESAFHKMRQLINKVTGIINSDEQALQVLEAMKSGTLRSAAGRSLFEVKMFEDKNIVQRGVKNAITAAESMAPVLHPFYVAQSRLYTSENAALRSLSNMFQVRVGEEGRAKSYFTARTERVSQLSNRFNAVFKDLTEAQRKETIATLRNSKLRTRDPAVRAARAEVRKLMDTMHEYATKAGVKMEKRANYFPWVYDTDKLMGKRTEFVEFLTQEKFAAKLLEVTGDTDPTHAANAIYEKIMGSNGVADIPMDTSQGTMPSMSAMNTRTLGFLEELGNADDLRVLNEFFADNAIEVTARYIDQVVKRAEFARRFGADGSGIQKHLDNAKELGATDKEIQLAKDFINSAVGFYGVQELHPMLKTVLKSWDHIFGTELSAKDPREIRKVQGAIMVYQNVRVLALATLTSFADAGGIIVRSDSPEAAFKGMRQGMKEIAAGVKSRTKGDKEYRTEMTKLAENLGIIDHYMINEMLGQMYGGYFMSGTARKINDAFFNVIGLQQWTRMSRVMALASGRQHIAELAAGGKRAERRMSQLNIEASDIVLEDGQLKVLTDDERSNASDAERIRDNKIRNALNEFVDQATVRPNSAQRPIFASHPDMALAFHLQQFTFSIHDRIVRGVLHETAEGNYWPVAAMVSYPAIMAMSNVLRELIQHGPEGDERKEDWTFADHLEMNIRRSGVTGLGTLFMDINEDVSRNGLPFGSLVGPTFDQAGDLVGALFSGNPYEQSKAAADAIPGNNVFKYWDLGRDDEDYIIEAKNPRT